MRNICILWLLLITVSIRGKEAEGIPFFKNYSSAEYGGHNRNFDVVTGKEGITYFANFEGLLSFDNSTWRMIYTPGYSRITRLFIDSKGTLWVGGYNIIAKVVTDKHGRSSIKPVISDAGKSKIGEVQHIFEEKGYLYFYTDKKELFEMSDSTIRKTPYLISEESGKESLSLQNEYLLHNGYKALLTLNEGLIILDKEGNRLYSITEANGLCSNNIKRIAEDSNGCIWGVTDNGIFSVYLPSMFRHYTPAENLKGEVTTIQRYQQQLYIGTLQGLYKIDNNTANRIPEITQACWQLLLSADNKLYAATSNGVFEIEGRKVRQLTHGFAMSLTCEKPGQLHIGETDGIYRLSIQRKGVIYQKIESSDKGMQFSQSADNRINCHWGTTEWHTDAEGKNISVSSAKAENHFQKQKESLSALKEKTIRTIYPESDSLIWLGGDFGVIKVDFAEKDAAFDHLPHVFIREINQSIDTLRFGGDYLKEITFKFSSDALPILRNIDYQYFLEGYDDNWNAWTTAQEKIYTNLTYGNYIFKVRARDSFGRVSPLKEYRFDIPWPFYLKWYSVVFYFLLLAFLIYIGIRRRLRKLVEEKERLERVVVSRTRQIMEQKDEIEEKSKNLENALLELRHTQADLVRQEKMATVGKLTKGLIDRILNPLNYINNFSHLSSGLARDLQDNLRSVKGNVERGIYEESMDIIDMMTSNLGKIEEHGGNTSRILKAMEEVLKERSKQKKRMDIVALCRQSLELLKEYYKEEINRMQVSLHTNFSLESLMIQGNEEQLGKTLMSLLNNGMYAITKKFGKQAYQPEGSSSAEAGNVPEICISMEFGDGCIIICLRDNGIGIEESIHEQIFDPFFTTKTTGEAAGVGLYLSKEIITNHNGTIQVHSRQGEYTEFIIKLPI